MGLLRKKIIDPLLNLLKQGVQPETLSLSFIFGMALGVIPILGITTALCVIFATIFRLNHVAIQIANYAVYPLQFLLLIPFLKMGGLLFGADVGALDVHQIVSSFQSNLPAALREFGMIGFRGLVAWFLSSLIAGCVLYYPFCFAFRRIGSKIK